MKKAGLAPIRVLLEVERWSINDVRERLGTAYDEHLVEALSDHIRDQQIAKARAKAGYIISDGKFVR